MQFDSEMLFRRHPDPMWVVDGATLQVLDVNDAAVLRYGWSREEFLTFTFVDLHPPTEFVAVQDALSSLDAEIGTLRPWRHRRKDGVVFPVEVSIHLLGHDGRGAKLVMARDASLLHSLENQRAVALASERAARAETEKLAHRVRALFQAVPENLLVIAPDGFEIVAASDGYLSATGRERDDLIGKPIFAAFPDDPSEPEADGTRMLRTSFERALASGRPDIMAIQRYPIPNRDGGFTERYWSSVNTPIYDADGQIAWIFHQVEDVTDLVVSGALPAGKVAPTVEGDPISAVVRQTQQLKKQNVRLEQEIAELHLAKRVMRLATWSVDALSGRLSVTHALHGFLGTDPNIFNGDISSYLALVHADDRQRVEEEFAHFESSNETIFRSRHRLLRPEDGRIIHLVAVGERRRNAEGLLQLQGIVQDVSELAEARQERDRAQQLNRIAGHAAKLGGWHFSAETGRLTWTDEMFRIHTLPAGDPPALDAGLAFYHPQDRARVTASLRECVDHGTPFDLMVRITTAGGQTIRVRAIGEPVRDADGRITGAQGGLQDIDDLMTMREQAQVLSGQLARTLENISDGFFTLDTNWRFGFVNARAGEMLRRQPEELVGRNVWEEFPDAKGSNFERSYERVVCAGETVRFEEYFPPLQAWFQINAYPAPDGIAVYFRDITDERRRNDQLRLLEAAVAQIGDMLEITGAGIDGPDDPCFVYVNPAFEQITGYAAEEVLGKTPRILQGDQTDRAELDRLRHAISRGEGVHVELINYRKDGSPYWTELDIQPLRDPEGRITHFIAVGRDVTERREASEALSISEERFRLIARASSSVIWDWNIASARTWWSDGMTAAFGHPIETDGLPSDHWEKNLHPEEAVSVLGSLDAAIASGAKDWSSRYRFRRAEGDWATVSDRAFIIRNSAGEALRVLGSMTDITEQIQLEERLRQSQKLEAVGQLTGGVAHDFNNLLTVILGNAEQMAEEVAHDRRLKSMADITASAAMRAAELTSRLLAFGRRQALQPQIVRLNRSIADMEGLLRRTLSEDIDIEFIQSGNLWPAEIDPGQLEVALLNLVINARDAMPGGGRMTIETANARLDENHPATQYDVPPGQYVMVAVTDSGTGMTAEVLARVFDPFFTTKEVGKGSGLGLSMVYGFVRQSGGHVRIYSEPGEGTTVKLYFPRAKVPEGAPTTRDTAHEAARGMEHVLVVEDDDLVREHVVLQLSALGYRISSAADGPAALAILREENDIDLLFTDVVMPGGMSGRELADAALDLRPRLPVLFTSGYTQNSIVHNGRLDPGVELLQKPYSRHELARRLRKLLDA